MAQSADRNLLFGVLALQMEFVSREALIAGMHAWVLAKDLSLGEILVRQGAMTPRRREVLDLLVDEHVVRDDGSPQKSLAEAAKLQELSRALSTLADRDVEASLAAALQARAAEPSTDHTTSPTLPLQAAEETGPRFQVLRPHARGGLGEINVARDRELNREVALKEIQVRYADDESSRARFLLEAEITGGLEHPGIVPVYSLGRYADGRPYYAMRLIRGGSLLDAIRRFHGELKPGARTAETGDPAQVANRALEFRQLLSRFIAVCEAVHYAHSRGILHRDLKPGNIMLGRYGETLVVDWGIAKRVGRSEARSGDDEGSLRPGTEGVLNPTLQGSALGTPEYMSPEQAEGKIDKLGPATDVYSLGATLYCLLTGKPPFAGNDTLDALRKVVRGEFSTPRTANPHAHIPPPLEAICLRAMALRAADRYPTAKALAEDVERFLADEPVLAFRDRWPARMARWSRRHRAATVAAGVLALAAMLFLGVLAAVSDRARRQTEEAKGKADASFQESQKRGIELEKSLYLQRIAFADRERSLNNLAHADELLLACPEEHRNWEWYYLSRLCHGEITTLPYQGQSVQALAASRDGAWIVSAGGDPNQWTSAGVLTFWDPATGQFLRRVYGPRCAVDQIVLGGDGRLAAVTGVNFNILAVSKASLSLTDAARCEAALWDFASEKSVLRLPNFSCIGLAPDGVTVAVAELGNPSVRVFDRHSNQDRFVTPPQPGVVDSAQFSPDGRFLATTWIDFDHNQVRILGTVSPTKGGLTLWDAHSGERLMTRDDAHDPAFSPDGKTLAFLQGPSAMLWNLPEMKLAGTLAGHNGPATTVAFSPDGRLVATGGEDRMTRIWDADSQVERMTFRGHATAVRSVVFTSDGSRLWTGGDDGLIKVWNASNNSPVEVISRHSALVAVLGVNESQVILQSGGLIQVVDRRTGAIAGSLDVASEKAAVDPRGDHIAAWSAGGTVRTWRIDRSSAGKTDFIEGRSIKDYPQEVQNLAFSQDGRQLAVLTGNPLVISEPNVVNVLDVSTGNRVRTIDSLDGFAGNVAFSSRGTLATITIRGVLQVWELASGKELARREISLGAPFASSIQVFVMKVGFNHSGTQLAVTSQMGSGTVTAGEIVVVDLESEREIRLRGHTAPITDFSFSPDDSRLVSASFSLIGMSGGEIKLWEPNEGIELLTLSGCLSSAFSPDGQTLVSTQASDKAGEWLIVARGGGPSDESGESDEIEPIPQEWTTVVHREAGFKVEMPGLPQSQGMLGTPEGSFLPATAVTASGTGGEVYSVSVIEIKQTDGFDPAAYLFDHVASGISRVGTKVSERRLERFGCPGMEFDLEMEGGAVRYRCQVYVRDRKIIEVAVTRPAQSPIAPSEADRYFNGFELLPQ